MQNNVMQAPNFLVGRQSRNVGQGAVQGIGGPSPARISIAAQKFTKVDAAGNQRIHTVTMVNQQGQPQEFLSPHLDCVLVGVNPNVSKIFYDTKFDPNGDDMPPACWSDNGVGPSSQAAKPQSATCAVCPNNNWGSAVSEMTGKQTKACNDAKKIAVMIPGDSIIYQFRIPPASLKNLKKYAHEIGGNMINDGRNERPADLSDIVTRISFESQGVLKFEPVSFITEQDAYQMDQIDAVKLDVLLGVNDVPRTAAIAHQPSPGVQLPSTPQGTPVHAMQPMQQPQYQPQPMQQPVQTAPAPRSRRGRPPAREQANGVGQPAQPMPAVVQGPPAMVVPPQGYANVPQPLPQHTPPAQQWTPPTTQAPTHSPAAPPFLQPQAQQPAPQQQAPFGVVQNAPAPSPELKSALDAALNFGKS